MKLVFYSGGDGDDNLALDLSALELAGKSNPKITFIPSCSWYGEMDFAEFVDQLKRLGLTRFQYCPVDVPQDKTFIKEAMNSDIIHLGGGNTFYFLKYLRQSKFTSLLKNYVKKGGVLTGLSAGGILMTPDIRTASYPSFDRDENDENIRNLKAMNLVNFEFFPHYKNSQRYDRELRKASTRSKHPLYALPDGSGVVVDGEAISFVGRAYGFYRGEKFSIR